MYSSTELWPNSLSMEAQIRFWLQSPEVPAAKRAATEAALPSMLGSRLAQCQLNLTLFLGKIRDKAAKPTTAEVTAFCQELLQSGQLDANEVLLVRRRIWVGTAREFAWHQERLRAVVQARYDEQMHKAHEDQAA
ncbi:hypothetical protein [Hymenobacter pini]|uniref:hypothetical protein n=1 Tax=Hymenobacter pini TaxID=2880879 RepID=UPI001CF4FD94|nr:hypothetical protein [Hymenobacter pini]MCA8829404.1 hypothetical protein [Hymenobacter pini]